MKVQRVYLDTSVIGGCFDEEFAPWSDGLMKDFRLGNFIPVLSEIVTAEVRPAPEDVQEKLAELETWNAEFADLTEEVRRLSAVYMERHIIPSQYSNDGLHIALATVAEADVW